MTLASRPTRPGLRPVLWAALLAGGLAALLNGALFLLTARAFEGVLAGPRQMPFSLLPVVTLSVLGALAAGAVYLVLARFLRRPRRAFTVLALVVLLASFATPFSVPAVPAAVVVILNLMHVVVFACVLALVPRRDP